MRRALLIAALALLAMPGVALADHCGADGRVSPRQAPVGTTFTVFPDLGATTRLRLYHDGRLVRDVTLPGQGLRYSVRTRPGDEGVWRARSVVPGSTCGSDVSFRVTSDRFVGANDVPKAPDTATVGPPARNAASPFVVVLAAFALGTYVGFRRRVH